MSVIQPEIVSDSNLHETARCQHRTPKGRCRQLASDPASTLCFDHARAAARTDSALQAVSASKDDFAPLPSLVRKPRHFRSAQALNKTLATLHNLLAEGKISPRRAAVIAYVDSLILGTVVSIDHAENNEPRQIIFDAPRPPRDLPDNPEYLVKPQAAS